MKTIWVLAGAAVAIGSTSLAGYDPVRLADTLKSGTVKLSGISAKAAEADPVADDAPQARSASRKYAAILPANVDIPAALPDLGRTETFGEAVSVQEAGTSRVEGYVLGEEGVTDEMRKAWGTLERARSAGSGSGDAGDADDGDVFLRAAGEIGYVPSGISPADIRVPGAEIGSMGNEVVTGEAEIYSAGTIIVDGVLIRLQGVRAPGLSDMCLTASGVEYDCDAWSLRGVEAMLAGRELSCEVTDEEHLEGGRLGWCNIALRSGVARDVGEIGVEAGIMVAEPGISGISPYLKSEAKAREAGNGVWSGSFGPREG
ncbi:thermonuclease family protein [Defluviimonas salinarum]|uniref:TNase-like domain-containing protein n=1 Tax=Defluviimonas salinarum TaxID=2992147 RepID=A0ABT3J4K8_9RHOB|nr:hypothetical protein [Defluviimonas salinarum]MCW3782603.1 hypothetical protein [Defluviimonas salinarum]